MNETEKAISLLRSQGYSVLCRTGHKPGFVHLIRFRANDGSLKYNVRLSKKGNKDSYYGDRSQIAEIDTEKLNWEDMK